MLKLYHGDVEVMSVDGCDGDFDGSGSGCAGSGCGSNPIVAAFAIGFLLFSILESFYLER